MSAAAVLLLFFGSSAIFDIVDVDADADVDADVDVNVDVNDSSCCCSSF